MESSLGMASVCIIWQAGHYHQIARRRPKALPPRAMTPSLLSLEYINTQVDTLEGNIADLREVRDLTPA